MAAKTVVRYSAGDRAFHWILSVCFVFLLITGFGLFDKRFAFLFELFGGGAVAVWVHRLSGSLFFITGMKFLLGHAKDTFSLDEDDKAWLKVMGGYLKKDAVVPPVGRYNAGQKIYGIVATVTALAFFATGLVMWNATTVPLDLLRLSTLVHSFCFVVITVFFIIHVYMGLLVVPGSLKAMTSGQVSAAWAKKFYPKWFEQIKDEEKS